MLTFLIVANIVFLGIRLVSLITAPLFIDRPRAPVTGTYVAVASVFNLFWMFVGVYTVIYLFQLT